MRRRHQFSTAALMALVLCTAVALTLLRDPLIRAALIGLALGSVLFVVGASVIYGCVWCVVLVVRLVRRLRTGVSFHHLERPDRLDRVSVVNRREAIGRVDGRQVVG